MEGKGDFMENRTNQIIELGDGTKYIIIRHLVFKDESYFISNRITDDEKDLLEEVMIMHEVKKDGKLFIEKVTDPELLQVIINNAQIDGLN